jgi:YHS domain-containing protein
MRRKVVSLVVILALAVSLTAAFGQAKKGAEKAIDPVCGIPVDKDPDLSVNHKGETYYFCSKADMETFKKNPDKYAKKK